MVEVVIRDLPDEVRQNLNEWAPENGRTPEEEARAVLEERFSPDPGSRNVEAWLRAPRLIQASIRAANGGNLPTGVVDEFLAEKREIAAAELARVELYVRGDTGGD
jgi:plasmid stability protein